MTDKKSELDKWSEVHENARIILDFLSFLNEQHVTLCKIDKGSDMFVPYWKNKIDLIYDYFNIDYNQLEKERRVLLESLKK